MAAAEAFVLVALASLAVRLLPFRLLAQRITHPPVARDGSMEAIGLIPRAVRAAARRAPFRALCIEQGLALTWMLRRRGFAPVLHYGIAPAAGGALRAHVWVSVGGSVILGGSEARGFVEVTSFPAGRAA